jgi:hypothetical protein
MAGALTGVDVFGPDITGGSSLSGQFLTGYFGDGSDGDATISGTFTAGRELHYNNLTIPAGVIFKPNGYRVFVKEILTIDATGSFNDDGINSTSQAGAAALGARNYLSANGLNGGNGVALTAIGFSNGAAGTVATNTSLNNLGQLTSGGRGGNVTLRANVGGAGGVSTTTNPSQKWNGRAQFDARFSGGGFNGGSGGGGGATNVTAYTSGTFISGGGGSGGGIVWIAAKTIINNGRISANGGNGFNGSLAVGSAEVGGGGGGGGGSVGIITASSLASLGTIEVNGGVGGTGVFNVGTGVNLAGVDGPIGSLFTLIVS